IVDPIHQGIVQMSVEQRHKNLQPRISVDRQRNPKQQSDKVDQGNRSNPSPPNHLGFNLLPVHVSQQSPKRDRSNQQGNNRFQKGICYIDPKIGFQLDSQNIAENEVENDDIDEDDQFPGHRPRNEKPSNPGNNPPQSWGSFYFRGKIEARMMGFTTARKCSCGLRQRSLFSTRRLESRTTLI